MLGNEYFKRLTGYRERFGKITSELGGSTQGCAQVLMMGATSDRKLTEMCMWFN